MLLKAKHNLNFFANVMIVLILFSGVNGDRSRAFFHKLSGSELDCNMFRDIEGKCRQRHLGLTQSPCTCGSDFDQKLFAQLPASCHAFICPETEPTCVSDPHTLQSICTECPRNQIVTADNSNVQHSCIEEGSCIEITKNSLCCNDGFIAENNKCVDIDECEVYPGICEQRCENHRGTYSCHCAEGSYRVGDNCIITDRCAHLNCSHSCSIHNGVPKCECRRGYDLVNETECKEQDRVCSSGYHRDVVTNNCKVLGPEPQLIFVQNSILTAYGMLIHSNDSIKSLAKLTHNVYALTYDSTDHVAYFAGESITAIRYSNNEPMYVTSKLNKSAISVTLNWQSNSLYLLDGYALNLWNVSSGDLRFETVLVTHNGRIRDVIVDPMNNFLYTAEDGFVNKALLQGKQSQKIFSVYDHTQIDVEAERLAIDNTDMSNIFLYYAVNRNLFCLDPSGRHAATWLTNSLPGPVQAMDVFEDSLYMVIKGGTGELSKHMRKSHIIEKCILY